MPYGCDQSSPFPVTAPSATTTPSRWLRWWRHGPTRTLSTTCCALVAVCLLVSAANRDQGPRNLSEYLSQQQAFAMLAGSPALVVEPPPPEPTAAEAMAPVSPDISEAPQPAPVIEAEARPSAPARTWAPQRQDAERRPSDHAPVNTTDPVRVRVVTIRARVTAYTPYDHAETEPQWADGIVAWHPGGRQRRVANHRYGLATDWSQFPPGATFIRVPGYMEKSFPNFPENFRVVDDACGQSRIARRRGLQPVIDLRFMTRYSAIHPRNGWGSRQLDVEVIYPENFTIPSSLRRWVVQEEWHTYHNGVLTERQRIR